MTLRAARFADIPRIVELMGEMHEASKYAELDTVDEQAAHRLIAQCVQRHGHKHDGGSFVTVIEKDGQIEGFVVGILDRVYHIGKHLSANDVFLFCSSKAAPASGLALFKAYLNWAMAIPKVRVIKASWTDAVPGAERMAQVYEKKGFTRTGEIFERVAMAPAELEQAA